ncbi:M48 family metallopeptidase [Metabacillus halosaccharovorans]|uniref:M48 family metallopeptidase n=1 Tax=Metabacillus halosaccharovorans TaxID=930124 RepID=UPI00203A7847|nr:M48 family metallopeptidase [Metabacillus halosaccharovorans]MCM3439571.1 M48 family metallopeptidase [Metabacillus halosaccharovorans]
MKENQLVHKHEETLFIICVITTCLAALYLLISIVGVFIFLAFALLSLFSHVISMSHIQLNGVRLRETQFPDLYEKVVHLSTKMELRNIPEVYILESGGLLNAFATKVLAISGKNMVVLYSDFVDIANESPDFDIDYIIAHELAHLKRNHISKSIFVSLAMWIPFLGTSYLRMAEYTCDRMAAYYTEKPQNAINGLLILAAGRRLYNKVNLNEFLEQYNEKKGFFATLTELLSTHPPIPKRIHEIETFMNDDNQPTVTLVSKTKQVVFIIVLVFFLLPGLFIGLTVGTAFVISKLDFLSGIADPYSYEDEYNYEDEPLMQSIVDDDQETVEQLLEDGADPNTINEFGESALMIAIMNEKLNFVPMLLEYGADPNHQDDYGWTPLMSAVVADDIESGKLLLESGADPTLQDTDGLSAIDYANDYDNQDFIQLLESYKNDPSMF